MLAFGDCPDLRGTSPATLQFDCVGPCVDQAPGTLDGKFRAVVRMDWEVSHDECGGDPARDGPRVVEDVRNLHMRRVGVAEHCHSERIANQDQIDAGFIQEPGRGKVVGRQRANSTACCFPASDRIGSNLIHDSNKGIPSRETSPGSSSSARSLRTDCI